MSICFGVLGRREWEHNGKRLMVSLPFDNPKVESMNQRAVVTVEGVSLNAKLLSIVVQS